ncbi:hypothetical protein V5O48_017167 [Marasmius crinis-equi]|uniref:Uncharacterized protein n=1 Tax=Marasmius crinis-equi TaxID=585013 RepID=A0ABR3EPQ8_9AGAR
MRLPFKVASPALEERRITDNVVVHELRGFEKVPNEIIQKIVEEILGYTDTPSYPSRVQRQQIKALIEAPSLKRLSINTLEWRGSEFIVIPPGLADFRVTDDIRISRLVEIKAIPHLQSLSISLRSISIPTIIPDVVLPQVKHMSLRLGAGVSSEVLRHIWAPCVEELVVELRWADRESAESLLVFLRHSANPPLRRLSWYFGTWTLGPATSLDRWEEIFRIIPTTREIEWTWCAFQDDWDFKKMSSLLKAFRDPESGLPELRNLAIDFESDSWPVRRNDIERIALEFIETVKARKQLSCSLQETRFEIVLPKWCYGRSEMKYIGNGAWEEVESRRIEAETRFQDVAIKVLLPEKMYSYRRYWRVIGDGPDLEASTYEEADELFGVSPPRAARRFEKTHARRDNSP